MKIKFIVILVLFISQTGFSQEITYQETELDIPTKTETIYGTLLTPNSINKPPLVIIILGSGPTDREGNNVIMKNNSLKYLAKNLSEHNIATYRYDKSVLSLTKNDTTKIKKLTFDSFINEAISVINYFIKSKKYAKIVVAGHSQGSLIGMIAANNIAEAFISLEGAGKPINEIFIEQIAKQAPYLKEETARILTELKKGKLVADYNPMLASLFNKTVQPFLIFWMKYNSQIEIKKLTIPILIIQGTKDIQVKIEDAELLHKANSKSQLQLIENMNHIFKEIKGDVSNNMQSYTNPKLPIIPKLTTTILNFIKTLN